MARKLSQFARRASFLVIAGSACLAAINLLAQDEIQVTAPANVVENPFVSAQPQPQPRIVPEEPQTSRRPPVTYQNPFAAMSTSPPVDTSLRPGPISRWRHSIVPGDETSLIKSAVLSSQPGEPEPAPWNQLPPADDLRHRAAARGEEADPTLYARLANPSNAIQFTPKPLVQPSWLTTESDETIASELNPLQLDPAIFDAPLNAAGFAQQTVALSAGPGVERFDHVASAFAMDSLDASLAKAEVSPTIISDCVDSPEGWLEQAQHAATKANSPEELSAIIELCARGMRGGPDSKMSSSLRRLAAWAHNRRGEIQADAGRADDALDDFQTAISLDPNCSLAIHNRAVTLAQQNQFAAALRDFNRVIELNPGLAVAYRNRAELLAALGRMDEAVADYNQAIESLPSNAQLYRGRAYAYQRLGNFHKALADLNRAIETFPNDPDTFTQRGNLAAEQGDFDQATTDFRRALSKDSNWAEAHRSLAWLQATCPNANFQNPQQAIASAELAAKLAPANDYLILETLAAARASAGQFDKAVECQQKALAGAPPELAPSLEQRLALYRHGRAFRSVPMQSGIRAPSDDAPSASSTSRNVSH